MTDAPNVENDGLPDHSPLGASIAKRWMNCPGSVKAEEAARELQGQRGEVEHVNEAAARGTAAHWLLESCLRCPYPEVEDKAHGRSDNPSDYVGYWHENGIVIDEEIADIVRQTLIEVDAMRERVAGPFGLDPVYMLIERRIHLDHLHPLFFSTLDVGVIGRGRVAILDLKSGSGVEVAAINDDGSANEQIAYYALGALDIADKELPDWREHNPDPEIELNIFQPLRGGLKQIIVRESDLVAFGARMVEAAARTEAPDALRVAGSWCKFCKAHSTCGAAADASLERARIRFQSADKVVALVHPKDLTTEERAAAQRAVPVLRAWCDAIEKGNLADAMRGVPVPGFKLVSGEGHRRFVDPAAAYEFLRVFCDVDRDDFYEARPRTPAQVEKRLDLSKKERDKVMAALTMRPLSGYTLVPQEDARLSVASASRWFTPQQIEGPADDPFAVNSADDGADPFAGTGL